MRVLYTARGIKALQVIGEAEVTEKYGIPGPRVRRLRDAARRPQRRAAGVPGVGDKTAAALITRFGSLTAIEQALEDGTTAGFPAGQPAEAREGARLPRLAEMVVRVVTDIPLPASTRACRDAAGDPERLVELADRWNLEGPVNRLLGAVKTTAA